MKKNQISPAAMGSLLIAAAALALISLSGIPVQAQARAPNWERGDPGSLGMSDRDRNLLDRETQLRMLEKQRRNPARSDPKLAFVQIKEDFRRIQVVDNEVMRTVSSRSALDYKQIAEAVGEIKKCAARLKTNLVFPEAEKEDAHQEKPDPDTSGLKPSLVALDRLIMSFVHNPIFKDAGVVDAKLGGKARRDLESIIELSDKLKKSAERMRKNAGN
jgi:hypothetical protein